MNEEIKALEQQIKELQDKKNAIEQAERNAALNTVRELIKTWKFSSDELKVTKTKVEKSKPVPFYFNPHNTAETCGVRGVRPKWFNENLKNGISKKDMLIKK